MSNPELRDSYRFCATLARREAKNFYYSFLLLPPGRRRSMCALYAFMRQSDDLADEPNPAAIKAERLETWRSSLNHALAGQSYPWPGLRALRDTVDRHAIPPGYLHAVLDGVAMDVEPRVFPTFADLHAYCYRVASAVGLSCLHIWGYRSDNGRAERLAEACGVALQLTNILRDVREDARLGRIYLPQEDLDRFGVASDDLRADHPSPATRALLEFQGRRAYEFYAQAAPLIGLVAPVGRPILRAIVGIYKALLDEIARRNWDVQAERVALPGWRKAAITLNSLVR